MASKLRRAADVLAETEDISLRATTLLQSTMKATDYDPESYSVLFTLLKQLRELPFPSKPKSVEQGSKESLVKLLDWFNANGGKIHGIKPQTNFKEGNGMLTTLNLEQDQDVLKVPYNLMFREDFAKKLVTPLGNLALTSSNIALSLALLKEKNNPKSFYTHYINSLPKEPFSPLYFDFKHIEALKGTSIFQSTLAMIRTVASQYFYFFKEFTSKPNLFLLPIHFSYSEFIWAISIVMTRQNEIPCPRDIVGLFPESSKLSALIPVWDLCNHEEGIPTSIIYDDNGEKGKSELKSDSLSLVCKAKRHFNANTQFYISYCSNRNSADLLLTGGFIPQVQQADDYLTIMVPKDPRLDEKERKAILDRSEINFVSERKYQPTTTLLFDGQPSPALTTVIKALSLSNEEILNFPKNQTLEETVVNTEQYRGILITLVRLLIQEYQNDTPEEIADSKTDFRMQYVLRLRRFEMNILRKALSEQNVPTNGQSFKSLTKSQKKNQKNKAKKRIEKLRENDLMTGKDPNEMI